MIQITGLAARPRAARELMDPPQPTQQKKAPFFVGVCGCGNRNCASSAPLIEKSRNACHALPRSPRPFAAHNPVEIGYLFDNRLVHGDNLLALNAPDQDFAER